MKILAFIQTCRSHFLLNLYFPRVYKLPIPFGYVYTLSTVRSIYRNEYNVVLSLKKQNRQRFVYVLKYLTE